MFRKVSLKSELVAKVEDIVKDSQDYGSIAEFVSEATELRIEELTADKVPDEDRELVREELAALGKRLMKQCNMTAHQARDYIKRMLGVSV